MKILLWIIGIIFLIGLLVVSGILDLIFESCWRPPPQSLLYWQADITAAI